MVFGSGAQIPIVGHGHTKLTYSYPPFQLNNVLHAPKIIKNLVSVRRFITDHHVSMCLLIDPFGFFVKDL